MRVYFVQVLRQIDVCENATADDLKNVRVNQIYVVCSEDGHRCSAHARSTTIWCNHTSNGRVISLYDAIGKAQATMTIYLRERDRHAGEPGYPTIDARVMWFDTDWALQHRGAPESQQFENLMVTFGGLADAAIAAEREVPVLPVPRRRRASGGGAL